MNLERDIALVDERRSHTSECQWLEFKKNNTDHEMIGKRCSALSNAARIEGRDTAHMLWGIEDETHEVVGTSFDPEAQKVGGMVLQLWLANALRPSIAFSFRTVAHPEGPEAGLIRVADREHPRAGYVPHWA